MLNGNSKYLFNKRLNLKQVHALANALQSSNVITGALTCVLPGTAYQMSPRQKYSVIVIVFFRSISRVHSAELHLCYNFLDDKAAQAVAELLKVNHCAGTSLVCRLSLRSCTVQALHELCLWETPMCSNCSCVAAASDAGEQDSRYGRPRRQRDRPRGREVPGRFARGACTFPSKWQHLAHGTPYEHRGLIIRPSECASL